MILEHYKTELELAQYVSSLESQVKGYKALCESLQAQADEMRSVRSAPAGEREAFEAKYPVANKLEFRGGVYLNRLGSELPRSLLDVINDAWVDFQAGAAWQRTQSSGVPDGWRLVPAIATPQMKTAGWQEVERQGIDPEGCEMQTIYHALLAAAPAQPAMEAQGETRMGEPVIPAVQGQAEAWVAVFKTIAECIPGAFDADGKTVDQACDPDTIRALLAERDDLLENGKQAIRWAPSSAHWSNELKRLFGDDARLGIDALESQLRNAQAERDALREALKECAASLAWNCFGECRAIHAGPIMPAAQALETASAALAASTGQGVES